VLDHRRRVKSSTVVLAHGPAHYTPLARGLRRMLTIDRPPGTKDQYAMLSRVDMTLMTLPLRVQHHAMQI
jgi:hypothetical protein